MTQEALGQIVELRKTRNFTSPFEVREIVGPEVFAEIFPYLTLTPSQYYTIRSVGKLNYSRITEGIEAVVCISNKIDKKYQIIQWKEGVSPYSQYGTRAPSQNDLPEKG